MTALGAILCGFLFACIISFADSLSLRVLHIWYSPERKKIIHKWQLLFAGRSRCEICRHPIAVPYLLPVAGFFLAGRHCVHCGASLPLRHVVLETIFLLYGVFLFLASTPLTIIAVALALPAMAVLTVVDFRYYLIPDTTLAWLLFLALAEFFLRGDVFALQGNQLLRPAAMLDLAVPVAWFLVFHIIRILSGGRLGFADATLVLALGVALGHRAALFLPTLAAFLAIAVYSIQNLQYEKNDYKSKKIAFGPYLVVAALLLRLWQ